MKEEMRAIMGAAAVRCAKAIGYSGAGTVEFIVDASNGLRPEGFWFMEMNTRLQVEHPVTEMITGIDLVEWQLRAASGEALPVKQDSLMLNGHAFEARIYAEDVPAGFLPATGKIEFMSIPSDARVDSGVCEGDVITPWYDPIISKLIVWGPTRAIALSRMTSALAASRISGTVTNLEFLSSLCKHSQFSVGDVDTGLIDRDLEALIKVQPLKFVDWAIAAVIARGVDFSDPLVGWNLWTPLRRSVWLTAQGEEREFLVIQNDRETYTVSDAIDSVEITIENAKESTMLVGHEGRKNDIGYFKTGAYVSIFGETGTYLFDIANGYVTGEVEGAMGNDILSPMPGVVKVVDCVGGDGVAEGDALVVIEAMKMEHSLVALRDGTISEVLVAVGQQVEAGQVLMSLEAEHE